MVTKMKIKSSVAELIGSTPLLYIDKFASHFGALGRVAVKLESMNPGGSSKDRVAAAMIGDALARGFIDLSSVIIEPTSGNTGVGLAMVAASRGLRAIFTMPETMSVERQKLLEAYGAETVLTPGDEGMQGAIRRAEELCREIPGAFIPSQFTNPANPRAHFASTGPEIWEDTDGSLAAFVAGAGTGGTVTGVGRYLKSRRKDIAVIAVEPWESAVISGEPAGAHGIQGIGAGFIPDTLDITVLDEVIKVKSADAIEAKRLLAREEGVLVGISSGAAAFAAAQVAAREKYRGKLTVALLPDTGERYLSME